MEDRGAVFEAHNWRRSERSWFGLFTLVPLVAGLATVVEMLRSPRGDDACVFCMTYPLMTFLLLLIYVPTTFNNPRLSKRMKRLWLVGFVLAGVITFPFYWYRHIWLAPYAPDQARAREHSPG